MEKMLKTLTDSKLFRDLSASTLVNALIPHATIRTYKAKEQVIELLEPVTQIGIVLEGTLQTLQIFADGTISLVDKLLPSYILGCDLICTDTKKAPYSVLAATDAKVIFFPASLFLTQGSIAESERIQVINRLLNHISHDNIRKYYRIAILSQSSLRGKVMTYLSMQARRQNRPSFSIPFTRDEMASFLCVNRSSLSHELSKMKDEGLLDFHKNHFTLIIPEPFHKNSFT